MNLMVWGVPAWLARVGGLPDETRSSGHRKLLHVARLKGGLSTTQPLRGDELRAVSAWLKERARMKPTGKAFFVSEQRKPCTARPLTCSCENTAPPLPCPCSSIPTCCATLAASPWPIKARILGSFRIISDTGTFSTPSSTRPPTQHGSKSCGDEPNHVHMPSCQHDCI